MVKYDKTGEKYIDIVLSYIKALNEGRFSVARNFFGEKFSYTSPMATLENPDDYINFMANQKGIQYDI